MAEGEREASREGYGPSGVTIQDVGSPPCTDCEHAARCAWGFACRQFSHWVATGKILERFPRVPKAAIYRAMYGRDSAKAIEPAVTYEDVALRPKAAPRALTYEEIFES
ncbi:MAG TPA: hypothetical protein VFU31_10660 [Candidatus Binatia bacterium]|nr:hypothetical protein [Candidatus Binatia bacterium]